MRIIFIITLLAARLTWAMEKVPFTIPSFDKTAVITGETDFPSTNVSGPLPAIILVGGTGLFDRDYLFGYSGTDADFLFRALAEKGTQKGFAVVRYDYRGIRCNQRTAPHCSKCQSELEKRKSYVENCINNKLRSAVNHGNIQDDILSVYNYALNNPAIDAKKIIILAHSEGTIHISNLVHKNRINPRGLLLMGAVGESPQSAIKWQATDPQGKIAKTFWWPLDLSKDGIITNQEIDNSCQAFGWTAENCKSLKSPEGHWTSETMKGSLLQEYQETVQDALNHKDTDPFLSEQADAGAVFASYAWWKMWFNDSTEIASLLTGYKGRLSVNNGSIDISTPGAREISYFKKYSQSWNDRVHLNLIEGRGHSLGANAQMGPIPEDSLEHLMREAQWLIQ